MSGHMKSDRTVYSYRRLMRCIYEISDLSDMEYWSDEAEDASHLLMLLECIHRLAGKTIEHAPVYDDHEDFKPRSPLEGVSPE